MQNIIHTEAFDLAYRFVTETDLNIFLTGKAGTGKTTFLKYLRENSPKKIVVAAPTGVAAINAGGVTLHSLFQLPFTPFVPSTNPSSAGADRHSLLSQIKYGTEKLMLFRSLELLVIDEASMVACHTVDAIDTLLRSVRRKYELPFGGVQVLFIGDLHQLSPVVKSMEWEFLKLHYPSVFFFDSIVLRKNVPVMIELKEIFRQRDDVFIRVLNEIRHNKLTEESLGLLNARLKVDFEKTNKEGYISLTTHNAQADEQNKNKLKLISSPSEVYHAEVYGNFSDNAFPAESSLELKKGAQVMFLKNDVEGKKYFNGKIGIIVELDKEKIKVQCNGDSYPIDVKRYEWKNMNYTLNKETREIIEEELGRFIQYPLRLAWAITIHKSQGLTFNKLIIDSENAFANGQVYVALSRCTSLEGLVLTSPINRKFLGADKNLEVWQEKNSDEKNLEPRFIASRQQFIMHELNSIFSWEKWRDALYELRRIIIEPKLNLPIEPIAWINKISEKQKEADSVAIKFKNQLMYLGQQPLSAEDNEPLQQRIRDAAKYFSTLITEWKMVFAAHPLSTDILKMSRGIDEYLKEINLVTHEILQHVDHCKNGFNLNSYLKQGKKITSTPPTIRSSYTGNQNEGASLSNHQHAELYRQLATMRTNLAKKSRLPLYSVFSNQAISNVCDALPESDAALLKVKGFGKIKVKKYGVDIINFVKEYILENNITTSKENALSPVQKKSPTVDETIRLFKNRKSIEDISIERGLTIGTIETHFAQAIVNDQINMEEVMPIEEAKKIAEYFPENIKNIRLTEIVQTLPEPISYGKLRMILAWVEKKNGI